MNKIIRWVGLGFISLLIIVSLAKGVLTQAAPEGISTLAPDWGATVSADKKSVEWSADLIAARWIDATTIEISSTKNPAFKLLAKANDEHNGEDETPFYDQRGRYHDRKNYDLVGWHKNPCFGTVYWDNPKDPWAEVTKVKIDMDFQYDNINDCVGGKGDNNVLTINVSSPENSIAYFKWLDPAQIQTIDNNAATKSGNGNGVFKQVPDYPNVYLSVDDINNSGSCQDRVVVNDDKTLTYYDLNKDGGGNTPESAQTTCKYNSYDESVDWYPSGKTFNILNKSAYDNNAPGSVVPDGDNPSDEAGVPSCESAIDNGFGWIICPILDGTDKLISVTENTIKSKLEINAEFTDNEGLHDAWTQLARISSGLLVIVALVMIVSTALGFEMVSSYTLKKMLPRIVIGAIGIWLSWALATTYVNFMNDLGRGITGLMFSPFKETLADGNTFANVDLKFIVQKSFAKTDPTTDLSALAIFSVPIISMVVGSGGIFGILAAAIPAIGAMLIGLFLLTLRQILIVFLLVLAPLGVAAWMLPNTQKVWKLWSGTFNKLLLMYPLFMGAFAAGKIFALIAADATKTDNGVLEVIVPMLAYISPFFFIPILFKLAGSIFGNITGMVNNKGKGVFDRLRGGLDDKAKARKTFKDQMGQERTARGAAGQGRLGEFGARFSRAKMRSRGGQPITGGALTLLNRQNVQQRVDSSMATTLSKLEQQQVEEETARMSQDGTLNDRNALRARAVTGSIVQRRAAINQLINIGDDDGMRFVADASANHADRAVKEMWSKVRSSEDYAKAFKDKAPDLTSSTLDLAFGDIKPSAIPGLSGSTIDRIFQHHAANISSADPDVADKAKQSMDRFLSSVQGAMKNDTLRNQLSANNMMALSGNIVAAGLGRTVLPTGGTVSAEILSHIDANGSDPKDIDIIKELTPGGGVGPLGLKPVKISAPRPTSGTGKVA